MATSTSVSSSRAKAVRSGRTTSTTASQSESQVASNFSSSFCPNTLTQEQAGSSPRVAPAITTASSGHVLGTAWLVNFFCRNKRKKKLAKLAAKSSECCSHLACDHHLSGISSFCDHCHNCSSSKPDCTHHCPGPLDHSHGHPFRKIRDVTPELPEDVLEELKQTLTIHNKYQDQQTTEKESLDHKINQRVNGTSTAPINQSRGLATNQSSYNLNPKRHFEDRLTTSEIDQNHKRWSTIENEDGEEDDDVNKSRKQGKNKKYNNQSHNRRNNNKEGHSNQDADQTLGLKTTCNRNSQGHQAQVDLLYHNSNRKGPPLKGNNTCCNCTSHHDETGGHSLELRKERTGEENKRTTSKNKLLNNFKSPSTLPDINNKNMNGPDITTKTFCGNNENQLEWNQEDERKGEERGRGEQNEVSGDDEGCQLEKGFKMRGKSKKCCINDDSKLLPLKLRSEQDLTSSIANDTSLSDHHCLKRHSRQPQDVSDSISGSSNSLATITGSSQERKYFDSSALCIDQEHDEPEREEMEHRHDERHHHRHPRHFSKRGIKADQHFTKSSIDINHESWVEKSIEKSSSSNRHLTQESSSPAASSSNKIKSSSSFSCSNLTMDEYRQQNPCRRTNTGVASLGHRRHKKKPAPPPPTAMSGSASLMMIPPTASVASHDQNKQAQTRSNRECIIRQPSSRDEEGNVLGVTHENMIVAEDDEFDGRSPSAASSSGFSSRVSSSGGTTTSSDILQNITNQSTSEVRKKMMDNKLYRNNRGSKYSSQQHVTDSGRKSLVIMNQESNMSDLMTSLNTVNKVDQMSKSSSALNFLKKKKRKAPAPPPPSSPNLMKAKSVSSLIQCNNSPLTITPLKSSVSSQFLAKDVIDVDDIKCQLHDEEFEDNQVVGIPGLENESRQEKVTEHEEKQIDSTDSQVGTDESKLELSDIEIVISSENEKVSTIIEGTSSKSSGDAEREPESSCLNQNNGLNDADHSVDGSSDEIIVSAAFDQSHCQTENQVASEKINSAIVDVKDDEEDETPSLVHAVPMMVYCSPANSIISSSDHKFDSLKSTASSNATKQTLSEQTEKKQEWPVTSSSTLTDNSSSGEETQMSSIFIRDSSSEEKITYLSSGTICKVKDQSRSVECESIVQKREKPVTANPPRVRPKTLANFTISSYYDKSPNNTSPTRENYTSLDYTSPKTNNGNFTSLSFIQTNSKSPCKEVKPPAGVYRSPSSISNFSNRSPNVIDDALFNRSQFPIPSGQASPSKPKHVSLLVLNRCQADSKPASDEPETNYSFESSKDDLEEFPVIKVRPLVKPKPALEMKVSSGSTSSNMSSTSSSSSIREFAKLTFSKINNLNSSSSENESKSSSKAPSPNGSGSSRNRQQEGNFCPPPPPPPPPPPMAGLPSPVAVKEMQNDDFKPQISPSQVKKSAIKPLDAHQALNNSLTLRSRLMDEIKGFRKPPSKTPDVATSADFNSPLKKVSIVTATTAYI